MTATDRTHRQSTTDHAGRPARIEAVTRDLPRIGPDCRDGKHPACDGRAWGVEADTITDCECACHWPTLTSAPDSWGVQYDKETP
jgi:hypothetical protein